MSTALQKLETIFSEETFTRKSVINYTTKYFADLYQIISELESDEDKKGAFELAEAQLARNPHNILSLYVLGIINFENKNFLDQSMERLLFIFKNAKKWNIVEYIAKEINEYFESDYALRYLASYYQATNKENEALDVWERLIKFDTSNPDLPEKVAHMKEHLGNISDAIYYYKIAFERNIARKRTNVESDIKKILELKPDSYSYLLKYETHLSELLDADVMIDIWKIIFFYYYENKEYVMALKSIKQLLNYEQSIVKQNNKKAKYFRHRLVDVYKAMYTDHTLFDKIEEMATLTNVLKQPKVCIDIFEKYIKYDVGKYVFHRKFGVGKIKSVTIDDVVIDFVSNDAAINKNENEADKDNISSEKKMTFEMAINSLVTLENDDLYVYKAYRLNELKKLAETNHNDFLTIVLKYKGSITTKDLKQELVPDVISEAAYTKWLENAKKSVRASTSIKFEKNTFLYNVQAVTYDVEAMANFEKAKTFIDRFNIYTEYLNYSKKKDSEEAIAMHVYFMGISNDNEAKNEERIISVIMLNLEGITLDIADLQELINKTDNYTHVYEVLPTTVYRERFLNAIIKAKTEEEADDIIRKLLYSSHVKNHYLVINKLIYLNKTKVLEKAIDDIFLRYKDYPESFIYFAQKILDGEYSEYIENGMTINMDILMIGLLSLIPFLTKLSDKKETSAHARKMLKVVYDLTFEKNYLIKFLEVSSEESVKKVFDEFQKLTSLDQHYKTSVLSAVAKRFPNLT